MTTTMMRAALVLGLLSGSGVHAFGAGSLLRAAPSARRGGPVQMPIGVPKVAYRAPGSPVAAWVDLYNRLYRERILFLGQQIDDEIANQVIGVMLYLDSEDNSKTISMYINSPGGSVTSGFAMFDTMRHIKSEVSTINVGLAASMGSFLLMGGTKGKRLALPHSRTMIHQPMGGAQGQASDIKIEAEQILSIRERIVRPTAPTRSTCSPASPPRRLQRAEGFIAQPASLLLHLTRAPGDPAPYHALPYYLSAFAPSAYHHR